MTTPDLPPGCANRSCAGDCPRAHLSRRTFITLSAGAVGALAVPGQALAALAAPPRHDPAVLFDRGTPTTYTGAALPKIGMPVGGGTTGQVYLAGDGRLWAWDIFNPTSFPLGGADFSGHNYAFPLSADQPGASQFGQGFALRTTTRGRTSTRTVDAAGFKDVRFTGSYPIGRVAYADPASPVSVQLGGLLAVRPAGHAGLDAAHDDHGVHAAEHVVGLGPRDAPRVRREPGLHRQPAPAAHHLAGASVHRRDPVRGDRRHRRGAGRHPLRGLGEGYVRRVDRHRRRVRCRPCAAPRRTESDEAVRRSERVGHAVRHVVRIPGWRQRRVDREADEPGVRRRAPVRRGRRERRPSSRRDVRERARRRAGRGLGDG